MPPADRHDAAIRAAHADGKTAVAIADEVGKYPKYVYERLQAMGLRSNGKRAKPKPEKKSAPAPRPKIILPPSRPPRAIIRKPKPPMKDRVREMSKPQLMAMLAEAVKNTTTK